MTTMIWPCWTTPASSITRSPTRIRSRVLSAAEWISDSTPQMSASSLRTSSDGVSATMRWTGRSAESLRAIRPDSVKTAISFAFTSSAANAAASHSARLTRPLREFSDAEVGELRTRLARLPHGSQRVAVAA